MTKNSSTKNKVGRPKLTFDLNTVELCGKFKATFETMADILDCDVNTISNRMRTDCEFIEAYKKGYRHMMLKLTEAQLNKALGGTVYQEKVLGDGSIVKYNHYYQPDTTMAIWLGKQYLGQKDQPDTMDKEKHELDLKEDDFVQ